MPIRVILKLKPRLFYQKNTAMHGLMCLDLGMKVLLLHTWSALRPKQWIKNLLIFVAPFAGGVKFSFDLIELFLGFIAFCLASSIGYVYNDLRDVEIDKLHPKKSLRPFASGALSATVGLVLIFSLGVVLIILFLILPIDFALVVVVYLINTYAYTVFVKSIPVFELFSVAIGFVLRLISGALILGMDLSPWFLIVGGFSALFVVSAKRLAEFKHGNIRVVRSVLKEYTSDFLQSVTSISIAVSVTGYCFWALTQETDLFWYQLSVMPFVLALLRYRWMSDRLNVEAPEDIIFLDRSLIFLSFILFIFLSIAIF